MPAPATHPTRVDRSSQESSGPATASRLTRAGASTRRPPTTLERGVRDLTQVGDVEASAVSSGCARDGPAACPRQRAQLM